MLGSWNQIFWKNKQQQKPKRNVIFHPPYDHKNKIKNFEIFLRIYRTPIFFYQLFDLQDNRIFFLTLFTKQHGTPNQSPRLHFADL